MLGFKMKFNDAIETCEAMKYLRSVSLELDVSDFSKLNSRTYCICILLISNAAVITRHNTIVAGIRRLMDGFRH